MKSISTRTSMDSSDEDCGNWRYPAEMVAETLIGSRIRYRIALLLISFRVILSTADLSQCHNSENARLVIENSITDRQ